MLQAIVAFVLAWKYIIVNDSKDSNHMKSDDDEDNDGENENYAEL